MMNKDKIPDGVKKFLRLLKKNQYVLIVLFVGLIILLLPTGGGGSGGGGGKDSGGSTDSSDNTDTASSSLEFSIEEHEEKMAKALSEIEGAGNVTVVLSLKTTMEQEVAVDEDGSGGKETVTVSTGSGTESPVTVKYYYPEYLGALIVAEGADNANVKLQITEAVSALTGLGADKISVINKMN